jgi:AraC-like DNA-binding protein
MVTEIFLRPISHSSALSGSGRAEMPWCKVVEYSDPLVSQSAIQSITQAEILPTARGKYRAEATQIGLDTLRLQRFKVNLPQITTYTAVPDRKSISFLTEESLSNMQHCGRLVTSTDIIVGGYDVEHHRSEAGFGYGSMSLPTDHMLVLYRTIIGHDFEAETHSSIIRPHSQLMSRLRALHKMVGQLAHDTPDMLKRPAVRRSLEEQLAHVMLRCLAEGAGVKGTTGDSRHQAIIRKFENFLAAYPEQPLYLTEICAGIGVGERTLRAVCEEHLGMGPIRFLTLRRMHLVRRALLAAEPSKATVTRIVTDYGFWELGRFSVTYRALFGESPSETLRRAGEVVLNLKRPSSLSTTKFSGFAN